MNEFEKERTKFELETKRHQSELQEFSITDDLANQLDQVHEELKQLKIKHQAKRTAYEPHLREL